ncbi:MAG: OsmC family protein [Anaerolineae bacterium]|nr:OsmC family protein [Anaerolineae bacterium]
MEMEIVFPGDARVDARMGNMVIPTNQDGSAPAPFGLFLASIGTCAGIYVLSFCRQRGIPTDNIRIVQRMQSNPLTRMIEKIELDIQVPPDFPDKYKEAVIRSANQCAVKKHLEQPPVFEVNTSVVELA